MKKIINNNWLTLTGVVAGALAGFLYWKFIGCASGSCPVTSSPWMSSLWGALIGGLLLSLFRTESRKKHEP